MAASDVRYTIRSILPGIGLALVGSGAYGVLSPVPCGKLFGIMRSGVAETTFLPAMSARNFSAGLAVLTFAYYRQYQAAGTLLLCWIPVGLTDTYLLLIEKGAVENLWIHVMNTGILAVAGTSLLGWW